MPIEDKIIYPLPIPKGKQLSEWVDINSPKWQKVLCCKIRKYQYFECRDGDMMDVSDQCWRDVKVFLLNDEHFDNKYRFLRTYIIGGVGFRRHRDGGYQLEFSWIHPFWRRKGLLGGTWETFEEEFGDFTVSRPRSQAMDGFLRSVSFRDPNV